MGPVIEQKATKRIHTSLKYIFELEDEKRTFLMCLSNVLDCHRLFLYPYIRLLNESIQGS